MISVSLSQNLDPRNQLRFQVAHPSSFPDWQAIVTTKVWSPLIWTDGRRGKDHFAGCEYIAIDCDNGVTTLKEAVEWCKDCGVAHIIGTTKSHGKEKISPSGKREPGCDRFRMVLKAETLCKDIETYTQNMSWFIKYFDADKACKDGGRFFYPCKEVVSMADGKKLDWKSSPFFQDADDETRDWTPEKSEEWHRQFNQMHGYNKIKLPPAVREVIIGKKIIPPGERHPFIIPLTKDMARLGFSPEEIVMKLERTCLCYAGVAELERTVRWAYSRWQGVR